MGLRMPVVKQSVRRSIFWEGWGVALPKPAAAFRPETVYTPNSEVGENTRPGVAGRSSRVW